MAAVCSAGLCPKPPSSLMRLLLTALVMSAAAASATPPCTANCTAGDVPAYVPHDFDCEIRRLAVRTARERGLGPSGYDLRTLHDALQLETRCGDRWAAVSSPPPQARRSKDEAAPCPPGRRCLYICPTSGDDARGTGTQAAPLRTLQRAVLAARGAGAERRGRATTLMLHGGVHWLQHPLQLTPEDSGLHIVGIAGENVTVSGGIPLPGESLKWRAHDVSSGKNIWAADLSHLGVQAMPGLRLNGRRVGDNCICALCAAADAGPLLCICGLLTGRAFSSYVSVQVVRARHPNGDPETQGKHTLPSGWQPATLAERWLPGRAASLALVESAQQVEVASPSRAAAYAVYPFYTIGIGGLCNGLFTPNASFWCNPRNPRDGLHVRVLRAATSLVSRAQLAWYQQP